MKNHISIEEAKQQLDKDANSFIKLMQHGTMQLEYFVPKNIDTQNAHQQDELYFITSGSSELIRDKEVISCKKGDVLFVPARMEHRFINFSNDFATWVVFYGKEGGEAEK